MSNLQFTIAVLAIYLVGLFCVNIVVPGQQVVNPPEIVKPDNVLKIPLTLITGIWAVIVIIITLMVVGVPGAPIWVSMGISLMLIGKLGWEVAAMFRGKST